MRAKEPDPDQEHFDVVDAQGNPTGESKRRSDVHRDGDWHRAFHCWVCTTSLDATPAVLFQRRSLNKDTHPDLLDVAVGGHYRSGEGFDEVVREIEEELGIVPPLDELVPIGCRRTVSQGVSWLDREIQDVYVYRLNVPVERLLPAHEEITALDLVRLDDLESLYARRLSQIKSWRYPVRPDNTLEAVREANLSLSDFIPIEDDYFLLGSRAAARVLQGEPDVRIDLW